MQLANLKPIWFSLISSYCLLLVGCQKSSGKDSGEPEFETKTEPTWSIIESLDTDGAWLRAHVPSDNPETVWIVGGQPEQGAIKIGNAEVGFEILDLPEGTPLLNWADGTSTNMWVGGLNGSILHWDGSEWFDYSLVVEEAIWGLVVTDNGQTVIAVGGSSRWGGEEAIAFGRQNDDWTPLVLPEELSGLSNLFKVDFDGEKYWMVGTSGALIYGDIEELSPVPTGLTQDLITVLASENLLNGSDVQIVGGRGTGIYVTGQNGTLSSPSQLIAGINGIATDTMGNSLLVGEMGYGQLRDTNDDTIIEPLPVTTHILHAAAVHNLNGKQYWYAVGGNLATAESTFEGSILTMEWSP